MKIYTDPEITKRSNDLIIIGQPLLNKSVAIELYPIDQTANEPDHIHNPKNSPKPPTTEPMIKKIDNVTRAMERINISTFLKD